MNQYTLPAEALLTSCTIVLGKLVNVEAAMKVNSAPESPIASNDNVRPELRRNAPEGVQYTPVVSF